MPRPREFDEQTVVEGAMNAFWARGFASTGMREVSAATGLLPGSLHQAFGSKRQLFLMALDRYTALALEGISTTLGREGAVLDNVRATLTYVASDSSTESRSKGCLMANTAAELAPQDEEVTAKVRAMFRRMEDLFAGALLRGQEAGEIGPQRDVRALARFLVTTIEGLRIYGKVQTPGRSLSDIVDTIVEACR
jgi:TetR/AcrR family transcriptional regulator, transcriptional repressor for nem operon